jgi:hypothetical protein
METDGVPVLKEQVRWWIGIGEDVTLGSNGVEVPSVAILVVEGSLRFRLHANSVW